MWLLQVADLGLEPEHALIVQLCLLCLLSQSDALVLEGALRDLRSELCDLRLELRQTELSLMDELLHTELWSVSACELRQTVLYMTKLLQTELWIVSACEHVMRLGVGGGGGAGGGGGRMFRVLC